MRLPRSCRPRWYSQNCSLFRCRFFENMRLKSGLSVSYWPASALALSAKSCSRRTPWHSSSTRCCSMESVVVARAIRALSTTRSTASPPRALRSATAACSSTSLSRKLALKVLLSSALSWLFVRVRRKLTGDGADSSRPGRSSSSSPSSRDMKLMLMWKGVFRSPEGILLRIKRRSTSISVIVRFEMRSMSAFAKAMAGTGPMTRCVASTP
mmetsp:Transcript_44262/g.138969  ORF Transcript_44262/g.138969 Transcript_44262/m.138969 type:complete len:211 (+) Transcript_44262:4022-4654(+)